MRRILLICLAMPALAGAAAAIAGADDTRTYNIEMYNAFGIVEDSDVRVSGVNAGHVVSLDVNADKRAVVKVELQGDLAVLGEDTRCSSEPQSLIAEYFLDCDPEGPPLPEGGTVPASQVEQTVQPDLVQNTLREPFKDRFRLLLNEFGTALAGNGESLNEAIRLGAPALRQLREATQILASQGGLIRDLNSDSEVIIGELAAQRRELSRFFDEAEDAARVSNERREDLSRDFELLDDFLAELNPMLTQLDEAARAQTPLLRNLRIAAPELHRLSVLLQPFNRAFDRAMVSLGDAGRVGRRALEKGSDELKLLARAGRNAPIVSEILADLLRDIDDPRRAVEIDDRVEAATGRSDERPGRRDTKGYTGLEGLLNYAYYQSLVVNQFDHVSHLFRFGIYEANTGPCGAFSSGRNPDESSPNFGQPQVPAQGGGFITDMSDPARVFTEMAECMAWLGPNQPGVTESLDLPKYHPSVCPDGSNAPELCDPSDPQSAGQRRPQRAGANGSGNGGADQAAGGLPPDGPAGGLPELPVKPDDVRKQLEDLLGLPGKALGGPKLGGLNSGGPKAAGKGGGKNQAAKDLLDFLLGP